MSNNCPICGYSGLSSPAYFDSGEPTYQSCRCCGFEYGYHDEDLGYTHEQWRQKWIDGGMVWNEKTEKPPLNWDPRKQLLNIGIKLD